VILTEVAKMLHLPIAPVSTNEKPDPILINILGVEAIVQMPNALTYLIHEKSGLQRGVPGFIGKLITVQLSVNLR
jgi:hypothetical protein